MGSPEERDVLVETRGPWRVITLNRPASLNALTTGMLETVRSVYDECKSDDGSAIILRGAG